MKGPCLAKKLKANHRDNEFGEIDPFFVLMKNLTMKERFLALVS